MAQHGIILINLGTPARATLSAVRRFLAEFLSDSRVVTLPAFWRYSLLYTVILPWRARKTLHAYQAIWTDQGSPLMIHSQHMCQQLQRVLGDHYHVTLGMRYGQPSIAQALQALRTCEDITVLPLYPQYASSSTGTAIEHLLRDLAPQTVLPNLHIRRDFHSHPAFIAAQATQIARYWSADYDYLLMSYHGLPLQHLQDSGCQLRCNKACPPSPSSTACYRAQCFQTSRLLAQSLQLTEQQYATVFQSRLGKAAWVQPYLDATLIQLAQRGYKRVLVACPSFVADCLETLEEIGLRSQQQWLQLGGEQLTLVPGLNAEPHWITALQQLVNAV